MKSLGQAISAVVIACILGMILGPLAHGATLEQPGRNGGKIALTDQPCLGKAPSGQRAYAYNDQGKVLFGCWSRLGNIVLIRWEHSDTQQAYPFDAFKQVPTI